MKSTKSAHRYSKALLEMAIEQNTTDLILTDMFGIVAISKNSKDFLNFIHSPVIRPDKKIAVMGKLFTDFQPLTSGFVALIVKNGRAELLPQIAHSFCALLEEHRGIISGTIFSAVPLDASNRNKILEKLGRLFKGELLLTEEIDASLIGGFKVTIGDKQIDASVSTQLKNLRQEITK